MLRKIVLGILLTSSSALLSKPSTLAAPSKVIVLLGPPGSGKGSQAFLMKASLQLPHISTGDLLREHTKRNSALGQKAKTFMDAGKLVPDDLILDMLFERISKKDCQQGFILDGFPRTLAQAEALDKRLSQSQELTVLNFGIPDALLIERLTGRLVCKECAKPYHLKHSPPKEQNSCDDCGGVLFHRSDDNEEVVVERLKVYRQQTEPLILYYKNQKKLQTISCEKTQQEIFKDIRAILKN